MLYPIVRSQKIHRYFKHKQKTIKFLDIELLNAVKYVNLGKENSGRVSDGIKGN